MIIIARYEIMLNVKSFSKAKKLQDAAFVQLKDPETGELLTTESGDKVGFELHSVQSNEFKRALRSTADLGLTKAEQERQKEINDWIADGTKPSEESLDFLDECEDKITKRMQRVFALVTKKLHHVKLPKDFADEAGIKVGKAGEDGACSVSFNAENIHKLYIALPDLSAQIGDAISDKQNFIKA